jgi:hypothetical protein
VVCADSAGGVCRYHVPKNKTRTIKYENPPKLMCSLITGQVYLHGWIGSTNGIQIRDQQLVLLRMRSYVVCKENTLCSFGYLCIDCLFPPQLKLMYDLLRCGALGDNDSVRKDALNP